ncbi:MAG TPA: hypothetical protein VGD10_01315 [Allosphingosinicella sp.]|uniref:hypothetical protein n=1 Tax=Allosphingosinicella sp. TaxID=2823234 RepID=UPI002EDA0584
MPEKYCDVVMKGGITSGLVYPEAVLKLSDHYGFKQIGGTSAGAIAAVMTAAAEVGRRNGHSDGKTGFSGLRLLTDELTSEGFIRGLFQPAPAAKGLLAGANGVAAGRSKLVALSNLLLRTSPVPAILALLAMAVTAAAVAWIASRSWHVDLSIALIIAIAAATPGMVLAAIWAAAWRFPARASRILCGNFFGICSGLSNGKGAPALTEWMHYWTRTLAGVDVDRPLLFRDLWEAPRYDGEPESKRAVDLVAFSSNISHREPHRMPLDGKRFYFLEDEFRRLFPPAVVQHLLSHSAETDRIEHDGRIYHLIPPPEEFPVVMAARMSLSFPLLLSAIPLYVPRYERAEPSSGRAPREAEDDPDQLQSAGSEAERPHSNLIGMNVCWFSDGGLTLNFPIHLFDTPLPRWPTFALNLVYPQLEAEEELPGPRIPKTNREGWQSTYYPFRDTSPLSQMKSFTGAMVSTVREWRDLIQVRAPGYRDRIAHVPLGPGEGGLNLDMPEEILKRVAARGAATGDEIVKNFNFNNHYWVRYRNTMAATEDMIERLVKVAFNQPLPEYENAWKAMRNHGDYPSYSFTRAQSLLSGQALDQLQTFSKLQAERRTSLRNRAPKPEGELRVTPKL